MSLYIYLTLFILWALFFYKFSVHWFTKKFKYLDIIQELDDPKYASYIRKDKKNWNFWEFYLVGVFLLIPRVILFLSSIFIIAFILKILSIFMNVSDYEKEQSPLFHKRSQFLIQLMNRIILFSMGFHFVDEKRIKFNEKNYPKLEKKGEIDESEVIVSNHVCMIDICYNFTKNARCFVMKESLMNIGIVGFVAKFFQGLTVNRREESSRKKLIADLHERVSNIKDKKIYNKLVIFPEGTTSNNHGLLNFKKGAFMLKSNLRIIGLKYGKRRICVQQNSISMLDNILGIFCNLYNELEVFEIDGAIGAKEGVKDEEFMNEVRKMMCQEFGFKDTGGSYREKVEFEKKYFRVIV